MVMRDTDLFIAGVACGALLITVIFCATIRWMRREKSDV